MCRLLAYWGAPAPAADLVVEPPHSLLVQVTAARRQTSGHVNPDGWGFAWYPDEPGSTASKPSDPSEPRRYRSARPMTDDAEGLAQLRTLTTGRLIAHVRHKSPGSPTEVAGNAPFVDGPIVFAHNGFVAGFRAGRREQLRARLGPEVRAGLAGDADSEVLFGLLRDRLAAGADLAGAVAALVREVAEVDPAPAPDDPRPADQRGGKFNLLVSDGRRLVATRWGNSLVLRRHHPHPGAWIVASEPFDDDPDWVDVEDRTLLDINHDGLAATSLDPHPVEVTP